MLLVHDCGVSEHFNNDGCFFLNHLPYIHPCFLRLLSSSLIWHSCPNNSGTTVNASKSERIAHSHALFRLHILCLQSLSLALHLDSMDFRQSANLYHEKRNKCGNEGETGDGWRHMPKTWYNGNGGAYSNGNALEECSSSPAHGNVDTVLYHSLVEMVPLLDSFMNQQWSQKKAFSNRASLIYTPSPAFRCSLKTIDNHSEGQKAKKTNQLDEKEDLPHDSLDPRVQYIELAASPTNQEAGNFRNEVEISELRTQIDQLKEKLKEKGSLLQSTESSAIDQLQMKVEELHDTLSEKQEEVLRLEQLLRRAESSIVESNKKADDIRSELDSLRCEVIALILEMENMRSSMSYNHPPKIHAPENLGKMPISSQGVVDEDEEDEGTTSEDHVKGAVKGMESINEKYLGAIAAATESPTEEMLLLVAEYRVQLQSLLTQPPFSLPS